MTKDQLIKLVTVLQAELDATNRQVEILSDALAESRREVAPKDEALDLALEALNTPRPTDSYPPLWRSYEKTINDAITAIKQALAAPVQDEHQSFIDSLPKDFDDKMFMQIDHWARQSYKRHQSSVRCQAITAADSYESHVIWATLRWAKENTPPAGEKQ